MHAVSGRDDSIGGLSWEGARRSAWTALRVSSARQSLFFSQLFYPFVHDRGDKILLKLPYVVFFMIAEDTHQTVFGKHQAELFHAPAQYVQGWKVKVQGTFPMALAHQGSRLSLGGGSTPLCLDLGRPCGLFSRLSELEDRSLRWQTALQVCQ